jgi:hypothetical protein
MPVTSAVLFANTHIKEFVDQEWAGSSKHKFRLYVELLELARSSPKSAVNFLRSLTFFSLPGQRYRHSA